MNQHEETNNNVFQEFQPFRRMPGAGMCLAGMRGNLAR